MDKIINEYLVKKNDKPKINTIEKSKKKDKKEIPKIKYIK